MENLMKSFVNLAVCFCIITCRDVSGITPSTKLCLQLCQMTGCSDWTSNAQVLKIKAGSLRFRIIRKGTDCFDNCMQSGRCFFLQADDDICNKRSNNTSVGAGHDVNMKPTWLLIVPYLSIGRHTYHMKLPDGIIEPDEFPLPEVRAMLYLKSESKLLVSGSWGIKSTIINKPPTSWSTVTLKYKDVVSMSADEEKRLLFLVDYPPERMCKVYKMVLNGGKDTCIFKIRSSLPCVVDEDEKGQKIFTNTALMLYELNYQGRSKQIFHLLSTLYTFTYVSDLNTLFLVAGSRLMKRTQGTVEFMLVDLPTEKKLEGFRSMIFARNKLYITFRGPADHILCVDTPEMETVTTIKILPLDRYLLIAI